ncbi:MAG TPA: MFS transporter [Sporichthyaceae bacterium]|jgi:MFS family permease
MRALIRRRAAASDMPREVWVLGAVAFAVALGFGIVAPIIPVFARKFGVGQTAAGLVLSAFAFMRLVFGPAGGMLVNRFGERRMMATGIGIVAVSSLLTGTAQTYAQMLILRGVGGVGSVMFSVSAQSLLLHSVPTSRRGRASSIYYGGFLFGGLTGPVLGGLLGGISLRLPFFLYAGTLALAGSIAMAFLGRSRLVDTATDDLSRPPPMKLRVALRDKAYQAALTVNTGTGWAIFGIRSSLVPLFVVESLHRGTIWTGIGLLVGSLTDACMLYPVGKVADQIGRRPLLLAATALGGAASLVLAFAPNLPAFLLAMAMLGATSSALSVGPSAVVGDVVAGRGGTVVAAFGMSSDVGAVCGPVIAGALAEHVSYSAAFCSTAAVLGLGLLMSLRMPETVHRNSAQRATQVGDQVGGVLDAHGESDQVGGHLQG